MSLFQVLQWVPCRGAQIDMTEIAFIMENKSLERQTQATPISFPALNFPRATGAISRDSVLEPQKNRVEGEPEWTTTVRQV